MKRNKHILTVLLFFCSVCLTGQNLQNYYTSKNLEGGMLYFIKPMKLVQSCKNACYFDQTIRPHNDTVSIGVTFTNKQVFKVDSVAIISENTVIGKNVKHLFTEQVKRKWDCRFFIYLTRDELRRLYVETPPILSFYGKDFTFQSLLPFSSSLLQCLDQILQRKRLF